ncbi:MAG: cation diffusion facilitator family transporter [Burkholderiaceae bacterium]
MSPSHADHSMHAHAHGEPGHPHGDPHHAGRAFGIAIALNSLFVIVEFGYGYLANSTALIADAGHNLSDVLGLLLAWGAAALGRRAPSARYTYGLGSSSILAALGNAMLLLLACGAIAWEAIGRFSQPPVVASLTVTLVAAVGIVVNGLSAWLFLKGSKSDLNLRGAYLHMAADAAVSLGVVVCGMVMWFTGWYWLDPLVSLLIVAVILVGTWGLLREATQLALSAVPATVDALAIEAYLRQCPGVTDVHDLHIWGMSTTQSALTVHLVMPQGYPGDAALDTITRTLRERYGIAHSTLQTEQGTTQHACTMHTGQEHGTPLAAAAHRH